MHKDLELEGVAIHAGAIAVVVETGKTHDFLLNVVGLTSGVVAFGDGYQVGQTFLDDSVNAVADLSCSAGFEFGRVDGVLHVVVVDSLHKD